MGDIWPDRTEDDGKFELLGWLGGRVLLDNVRRRERSEGKLPPLSPPQPPPFQIRQSREWDKGSWVSK
jgi:hypothetical protein